ncbi:twin-arginine translocation signal domain-containing protein, partial [Streptomyces daliensis]|nr:twin-arginine translocation signal domain-containing protein [Streptomyces daliensis]
MPEGVPPLNVTSRRQFLAGSAAALGLGGLT